MSNCPNVLIMIVNYNGGKDTVECLESISRMNYDRYQVLVCDNASTDDSVDSICTWASAMNTDAGMAGVIAPLFDGTVRTILPHVVASQAEVEQDLDPGFINARLIVVPTSDNAGFAGGNNVGLRYALKSKRFDYVWLLNNDAVCLPDALEHMVRRLESENVPSTCGSRVMHYYRPEIIQALGGARFNRWTGISGTTLGRDMTQSADIDHRHLESRLDFITGCSWLIPVDFVRTVGLMQEDYFLYFEEIDWCLRARGRYQMVYAENAVVYHKEGASIGSPSNVRKSSLLSDFYIFRNKLTVIRRFNPVAYPVAWLVTLIQSLNRIRQGHPEKAVLIWKILFGKRQWSS